jgi:hypothetical protein
MDTPERITKLINTIFERLLPPIVETWVKGSPVWFLWVFFIGILLFCFIKYLCNHYPAFKAWLLTCKACLSSQAQAKSVLGKKGRLTILISPLSGDIEQEATSNLRNALHNTFGNTIDFGTLPPNEQLVLAKVGIVSQEIDKLRTKAKEILKRRQANLIIWGKVIEKSMLLYIDVPDNPLFSNHYQHDEPLALPQNLSSDMSVVLSALILHWASLL